MGVLDDAIREHLDLKRRHGAEEEELRRQEEEALGPARREVATADSDDGDATGEQGPPEVEAAEADQPELSEVIPDEAVRSDAPTEEEEAPELDESSGVGEAPELQEEPVEEVEPPHDEAPAAHTDEPLTAEPAYEVGAFEEERGDTPPQGFETVVDDAPHDEGELLEDEEDGEGEPSDADADVLEDTPDFLQETPEHDRLWFEHKPPRDFDFD